MRQKKNRIINKKRRDKNRGRRRLFRCIGVLMWVSFSYLLLLSYIPDEIYLSKKRKKRRSLQWGFR